MRVIWRLRHLEVHLAAAKASSCLRAAAAAPGPSGLPQAAVTQRSRARDTPGALRTIALLERRAEGRPGGAGGCGRRAELAASRWAGAGLRRERTPPRRRNYTRKFNHSTPLTPVLPPARPGPRPSPGGSGRDDAGRAAPLAAPSAGGGGRAPSVPGGSSVRPEPALPPSLLPARRHLRGTGGRGAARPVLHTGGLRGGAWAPLEPILTPWLSLFYFFF